MPALTLPSGGARAYFGDAGLVFAPEVLISWGKDHWRAGGNLGAAFRQRSQILNAIIESEITAHGGVGYRFQAEDGSGGPPLEISGSVSAAVAASRPFQASNQAHLELRGMAAYDVSRSLQLFGGAGLGLVRGWGTPDFRFFAGARFGKEPPAPAGGARGGGGDAAPALGPGPGRPDRREGRLPGPAGDEERLPGRRGLPGRDTADPAPARSGPGRRHRGGPPRQLP